MVTITDSMRNNKSYNGSDPKFGITYKGVDCIVKVKRDQFDTSVFSEYICSKLINRLGFRCQEVTLGEYRGDYVAIVKDFTTPNITLHSFRDIKQSSEDTDIEDKEYTYDDVIYLIDKHLKLEPNSKQDAKEQFWDMFILDAILANRDRHWGNWGYLSNGNKYRIAPIYDNGNSLFPGIMHVIGRYINQDTRKEMIRERTEVFPASVFKIRRPDRNYKTNYKQMFSDLRINKLLAARVKIFKKCTWEHMYKTVLYIVKKLYSELERNKVYSNLMRFYLEIIVIRYRCIILREEFDSVYNEVDRMVWNETF